MNSKTSPLVLFGAQSGRPTEADVIRTLETAREAGYSDFMVYARSGLELEYMGEEWLTLVGHYLHHAERLGIVSSGHLLEESSSCGAAACNGLPLHVLKGMSKPGVDDIFTRTGTEGAEWLTLATIQHAAGRTGRCGMAELFALGPADLAELLQALESRQFAVNVVEEDEPTVEPVVFDFDDNGIFEEGTGRRFATVDEALKWLTERKLPDLPVALEAGNRAADLALRRYDDGTAALLNLREEDRALVFVADDARIPVALPARGVWVYRPVATSWSLSLDRPNRRRILFPEDGVARIVVERPTSVRFALCALPAAESTVTLDGAPLVAERPCTFLGFGYDNGYRETERITLDPGEHVLTCSGHGDAGLFLPALMMEGNFAVADEPSEPGQTLRPLPERVPCGPLAGTGLGDFAGKATYSADVDIPVGAEALEIGTGHAAASVRLGGHDLGTRLFAPWRFAVPTELRGTRQRMEITVTTSIRPIFGQGEFKRPWWVRMIPEEKDTGLAYARWV